jgi:hypothetical protein
MCSNSRPRDDRVRIELASEQSGTVPTSLGLCPMALSSLTNRTLPKTSGLAVRGGLPWRGGGMDCSGPRPRPDCQS